MSWIKDFRTEQGQILQNNNGQYFFVCSMCNLEFVTLQSFVSHQTDMHNKSPIVLDDCVAESKASNPSNPRPNTKKEAKASANSTDRIKFAKPKQTILVPPTRKVQRKRGGQRKTSAPLRLKPKPFVRELQPQALSVEMGTDGPTYKCKNCNLSFMSMLYLESHEEICQIVSLRDIHSE